MANKKNILDKLAEELDKIKLGDKQKEKKVKKSVRQTGKKTASKKQQTNSKNKARSSKQIKKELKKNLSAKSGKTKGGISMEELLKENPIEIPEVGDVLEGKIINVSSNSILLDLGPLGAGIVLGKETKDGLNISSKLKVGDKVSAALIDLENEDGYIELSIREASCEKSWDDIERKKDEQETITIKILDANRGGLIVEVNGISGFLPVSQLSSKNYPRVEDGNKNKILEILKNLVGKELNVKIIDIDKEEEKLIVSEKAAFSDEEKKIISELKVGDVIEGEVSGVVDFGAFVKFLPPSKKDSGKKEDELEGLAHISELAWQLINDPREIIKRGDRIKAQIIGIDNSRISLSVRALEKDPWKDVEKKYKTGEIVKGKVDKINRFGAFVYLDKDIHGLAHVSEFQEAYPGKRMDDVIKEGESYQWEILSIERKEHRMGLVLVKDKGDKKTASPVSKKKVNKKKKVTAKKEKGK